MNNLVVADASIQGDAVLALALFDLLKDTRQLEYMAHQFHWNITGDKFKSMHDFYEEEYDQLFKDQDEIAEQIRQQGFFVPVIDNITLDGADYFKANEFETQLIHYYNRLGKNIELINKVNDLAKDNIAVQDLCARLQGLRSLTMNLKAKAMLKANEGVLTSVVKSAAEELFKEGDKVNISGDISNGDYNCRVSSTGVVEENQKTPNSKVRVTIDEIDGDKKVSMLVNPNIVTLASSTQVIAGFDKGRYKEIDEESNFFKILREDCDIRPKIFYAINKGLRLAIRIVKGTFENASIRYFALKNKGGYIRVELNDKIYIIGYTVYDSGKIKVWTRELKTNVPVNAFDYSMLNMYAKPANIKMIQGMLPTWMSI